MGKLELSEPKSSDTEVTRQPENLLHHQDKLKDQSDSNAGQTELLPVQTFNAKNEPQKQAQEVGEKKRIPEVTSHVRRAAEFHQSLDRAIMECDKAIAEGMLDQCMRPLSDFAKQHGTSAALAKAREACESNREHKATQVVRDTVQSAQRQLRSNSAQKAESALKNVKYAIPFARAGVRDEWRRLMEECAAALNGKQSPQKNSSGKRNKTLWYVTILVLLVVMLTAVGVLYYRQRSPERVVSVPARVPAAGVPISEVTDLEINASPWAKVVSIQGQEGNSITLPDGDHVTPIRLDSVKVGTYKVILVGPDGNQEEVECNVSSEEHLCTADVGLPNIKQILTGAQP